MEFTYADEEFEVLEDGWGVRLAFSYGNCNVFEARSPAGRIHRLGFGKGVELYADVTHPST